MNYFLAAPPKFRTTDHKPREAPVARCGRSAPAPHFVHAVLLHDGSAKIRSFQTIHYTVKRSCEAKERKGRKAVNQIRWAAILLMLASLGCGRTGEPAGGGGETGRLQGMVKIDGSSTVYPITEAVAEEFQKTQPEVRVTVGIAGTGGGFKRFAAGETDISDASRPIDPSEAEVAAKNGIPYIELPVAYDGLSVLVNPRNDFVSFLTVEELQRIWQPGSTVRRWS